MVEEMVIKMGPELLGLLESLAIWKQARYRNSPDL
jgi:hypothetical protein